MISNITALVDFAVAQTYNRLCFILKCYYPTMRTKRMNSRCPVHKSQEFPAWLSSTLSCIGPCHISDGPCDTFIVYATTAETMNNYGRRKPVEYVYGDYDNIMTHLRFCKVAMAPLNLKETKGSFYPSIRPVLDKTWTFYGQVHKSHYESEDINRIFLVTNSNGVTPFEDIGMTIGFVDDPAVVDAIAALPPPPNIPPGQTPDSEGCLVGGVFRVNYFGIKPAVPAQGNKPAQKRGIYVIGRGADRYFQHSLGKDIHTYEITGVLRDRMTC